MEILNNFSKKFKVSKEAITTRLKTLNLISEEDYKNLGLIRANFINSKRRVYQATSKMHSRKLESKERGIITTQDVIINIFIFKYFDKLQELIGEWEMKYKVLLL